MLESDQKSESNNQKYRYSAALYPLLLLALLLGGCQTGAQSTPPRMAETMRETGHSARLSVFLNLKENEGPGIRLEVSNLEILVDDIWLPVNQGPLELDSEAIGPAQLFLGGRAAPPGYYQQLRFTVDRMLARGDSGQYDESAPPTPFPVKLNLPAPLHLEPEDSRSLFLTWDVSATLEQPDDPRPVIIVAPQLKQLLADLVYVSCPDIDTIFVVRSDKNWVADSFGIKGRPTYLAMDPDPSQRRLLILASGESAIKVVDLSSQRVINFFHLQLTDVPTFMTISPDGKWAYVLEERSSYLSRIDLVTGRSAARVRLGYRPLYAVFLTGQNLLAVSSGLSQAVLLLNPMELTESRAILTGDSPQGLLALNNQLYIAESGDHTVSIFDLATLRSRSRLEVGFGPRRLTETDNYIYVSNYDSGSLSVLIPEQLGALREIHGLAGPSEMAFERARRQLYVSEEEAAGLAVIDSTSNQITRRITLGARPLDLAILQ